MVILTLGAPLLGQNLSKFNKLTLKPNVSAQCLLSLLKLPPGAHHKAKCFSGGRDALGQCPHSCDLLMEDEAKTLLLKGRMEEGKGASSGGYVDRVQTRSRPTGLEGTRHCCLRGADTRLGEMTVSCRWTVEVAAPHCECISCYRII